MDGIFNGGLSPAIEDPSGDESGHPEDGPNAFVLPARTVTLSFSSPESLA